MGMAHAQPSPIARDMRVGIGMGREARADNDYQMALVPYLISRRTQIVFLTMRRVFIFFHAFAHRWSSVVVIKLSIGG